jgi:hypothetical protein
VTALDPGLRTLAVEGEAAYRDRFELVHRRSAARPNEQWQADHTLLDLQILDPYRVEVGAAGVLRPVGGVDVIHRRAPQPARRPAV